MDVAFERVDSISSTVSFADNPGSIGKGSVPETLEFPTSDAVTHMLPIIGGLVRLGDIRGAFRHGT